MCRWWLAALACFPKDTLALTRTAQEVGRPIRLVETVVEVNEARKTAMARKIIDHCGGDLAGKTIAVLGVTFKPSTDDMRDSPALVILPALQAAGAVIRAFDPEGMAEAKTMLSDAVWCDNAYDAMQGADAMALVTEWNEFRNLDRERMKSLMEDNHIIDLRNIYDPAEMQEAGFHYTSVGRP